MKIENQVVSLELAKKLFTLGVKQDSFFYWHTPLLAPDWHLSVAPGDRELCKCPAHYSAFTVPELGEIMPVFSSGYNQFQINKIHNLWVVSYECSRTFEKSFSQDKLSDCIAKMLIYLLENKLMELPE